MSWASARPRSKIPRRPTKGERDCADGCEMVERLRGPAFFTRVFLDDGILTWPNGFDLDSIALHTEMKERGLLRRTAPTAS